MNPLEKALASPGRHTLAIRAKCWDCEGREPGWQRRVRTCVVKDCPLYHVRPYQSVRVGGREYARRQTQRDADASNLGAGPDDPRAHHEDVAAAEL